MKKMPQKEINELLSSTERKLQDIRLMVANKEDTENVMRKLNNIACCIQMKTISNQSKSYKQEFIEELNDLLEIDL